MCRNDSKMFNRDNNASEANCREWFCNLTGMTEHSSVDVIRTLAQCAGGVCLVMFPVPGAALANESLALSITVA